MTCSEPFPVRTLQFILPLLLLRCIGAEFKIKSTFYYLQTVIYRVLNYLSLQFTISCYTAAEQLTNKQQLKDWTWNDFEMYKRTLQQQIVIVEMTQQWWSQGLKTTRNNYFKKKNKVRLHQYKYVLYNNRPGYRSFAGVLFLYKLSVFKENAAWLAAASRQQRFAFNCIRSAS